MEVPAAGTKILPSAKGCLDYAKPEHQGRPAVARYPLHPCLNCARDTRQDLEAALLASLLLEFGLEESEHMVCFDRLGVRCVKVRLGARHARGGLYRFRVAALPNRHGDSDS